MAVHTTDSRRQPIAYLPARGYESVLASVWLFGGVLIVVMGVSRLSTPPESSFIMDQPSAMIVAGALFLVPGLFLAPRAWGWVAALYARVTPDGVELGGPLQFALGRQLRVRRGETVTLRVEQGPYGYDMARFYPLHLYRFWAGGVSRHIQAYTALRPVFLEDLERVLSGAGIAFASGTPVPQLGFDVLESEPGPPGQVSLRLDATQSPRSLGKGTVESTQVLVGATHVSAPEHAADLGELPVAPEPNYVAVARTLPSEAMIETHLFEAPGDGDTLVITDERKAAIARVRVEGGFDAVRVFTHATQPHLHFMVESHGASDTPR